MLSRFTINGLMHFELTLPEAQAALDEPLPSSCEAEPAALLAHPSIPDYVSIEVAA